MTPTREAVRDLAKQCGYSVSVLKPHFGGQGEAEHPKAKHLGDYRWPGRRGRRAFMCAKRTDLSHLPVETEPINLPKPQRQKHRLKSGEADRAMRLLQRTDSVLSGLSTSRRWKLANALGDALQVLRKSHGEAPEDRLRELKGDIRAFLQQSGRTSAGRHPKRGSRTN